jgi:hypothetical protein
LSKLSGIKDFSFRLKYFLTYFFMLLESIYIKLSSASFWTFTKLYLFILRYKLFLNLFRNRSFWLRLTNNFFLCHLSLKNCHEVLIAFNRNFLIRILKLLSLRLSFKWPILNRFRRYWRRFLVCIFLLRSSIWDFRSWFFYLGLFIVFFFFLLIGSFFHRIGVLFSFLHRNIFLIFLSTHSISTHLFL